MHFLHLRYSELQKAGFYEDYQSLLHHSVAKGRTRYINLYMQYLSKVSKDLAPAFSHIMPELVDQPMFTTFFDAMQISSE